MKVIASRRLYLLLSLGAVIFALTYFIEGAKTFGLICDILILVAVAVDFQLTARPHLISASRESQDRLSIGRVNEVLLFVHNKSNTDLKVRVRDDCPRNLNANLDEFACTIKSGEQATS